MEFGWLLYAVVALVLAGLITLIVMYSLSSSSSSPRRGRRGHTGYTGMDGAAVNTGATGLRGLTGPTGVNGAAVNTGATGPTGIAGPTGSTGLLGPTGSAYASQLSWTSIAPLTGAVGTPEYITFSDTMTQTILVASQILMAPSTMQTLRVQLDAAAGSTGNAGWRFIVHQNGTRVPTLECDIAGSNTTCNVTAAVTAATFDTFAVEAIPTGTGSLTTANVSTSLSYVPL
jgi:hypothetical protein